jgi:hypothetical protein
MNTDEEMSEGRSELVFRRSLNATLMVGMKTTFFSVFIRGFKSVLLNRSGAVRAALCE